MKIILHDTNKTDGLAILALRAAMAHLDASIGAMRIVDFENGESYTVRRNKASVAVWKRN